MSRATTGGLKNIFKRVNTYQSLISKSKMQQGGGPCSAENARSKACRECPRAQNLDSDVSTVRSQQEWSHLPHIEDNMRHSCNSLALLSVICSEFRGLWNLISSMMAF